jgi:hypothetical protein
MNNYQRLQSDISLLNHQYDLLEQNNTITSTKTRLLEQEVELHKSNIFEFFFYPVKFNP